ncbi:DUF6009 family protein [Streptomyces sp. NPDC005752]|uniref:DUF6009 family protein n=1 Tax=Streptomyces sp. NPDC005752 TaxID=3157065 RepID=UPI0033C75DCF
MADCCGSRRPTLGGTSEIARQPGRQSSAAPGEAVDPRTIEPRRVGETAPRSQGKLRSEIVPS